VEEISWLSAWATGGLRPDLVVLLDIDPAAGLARIADRLADRLEGESVDFHERVRYAFLDLAGAEPRRYLVIDATAAVNEIAAAVIERVRAMLPATPSGPIDPGRTDAVPTDAVPTGTGPFDAASIDSARLSTGSANAVPSGGVPSGGARAGGTDNSGAGNSGAGNSGARTEDSAPSPVGHVEITLGWPRSTPIGVGRWPR
jgi:dTMP kinase